jgi:hypothetical protein
MEAVAYFIIAVALIAAGCVATVLSVYVIPLWIRVRGQGHGRFAGLSAAQTEPVSGCKRMVGGPGQAIGEPAAPAVILA